MTSLAHHAGLVVLLLMTSWVVIIGGVGAALAVVRGAAWWTGLLISVLLPIPGLGWLVCWLVSPRFAGGRSAPSARVSRAGTVDDADLGDISKVGYR